MHEPDGGSWRSMPKTRVMGGDVNDAWRVETDEGPIFVKANNDAPDEMFAAEAAGLALLSASAPGHVPNVRARGYDHLALEWIEPGSAPAEQLGEIVAGLHAITTDTFGLDHDNFIGRLPQSNRQCSTWSEFYLTQRIEPQLAMARDAGLLNPGDVTQVERASQRLCDELPLEPPRLLHGDLWAGNAHAAANGNWYLIDPAVYFGHREIELAFMQWGGAMQPECRAAYDAAIGMPDGFDERHEALLTYPMLVHANMFGGHYVDRVRQCSRQLS